MSLKNLSDLVLVAQFKDLVAETRERLVDELAYIGEMDRRKLFFERASLRTYLVAEHGLDEYSADRKIRAARLLKRIPSLTEKLKSGALNISLLEDAMGCAHREKLSDPELEELCHTLSGMSCAAAKREIASRYPETTVLPRDQIRPITANFSEVRFVASHELLDQLEEIRGLLAHSHPGASLAEILGILATEYRERHHPEEKLKRAEERRASKESPTDLDDLPALPRKEEGRAPSPALIRELIRAQGYRCSYNDPRTHKRCNSTHALEIDHRKPWSHGGKTELSNLRFLCAQHHARVSFLTFGDRARFARR
jgi:5-methylcytosine-specific restriction endonuclease McrA